MIDSNPSPLTSIIIQATLVWFGMGSYVFVFHVLAPNILFIAEKNLATIYIYYLKPSIPS